MHHSYPLAKVNQTHHIQKDVCPKMSVLISIQRNEYVSILSGDEGGNSRKKTISIFLESPSC